MVEPIHAVIAARAVAMAGESALDAQAPSSELISMAGGDLDVLDEARRALEDRVSENPDDPLLPQALGYVVEAIGRSGGTP